MAARAQETDVARAQDTTARAMRDDIERREATLPKPATDLFSINGAVLGTVQWIAAGNRSPGPVFGEGSIDLSVTVRPRSDIRLFLDTEALIGPGPDADLGTLSRLDNDADRLGGAQKRWLVRELFLRLAWLDERVRLSVGKLDVGHYFDRNFFAEDETTQFLDAALVGNPMLKAPPNGPGAALRISADDWRYAVGLHAPDDIGGDISGWPYLIGEVGRRNVFAAAGHYRLWMRVGGSLEDRRRLAWGGGVSIDQLVAADVGVFLRVGLGWSDGEDTTSYAWSTGVEVTPRRLGRPNDRIGVGYSEQREPAGRERLVEAYYRVGLADRFFVIGNVQWLVSGPNLVTGGTNRHVVIPGLRALLLF